MVEGYSDLGYSGIDPITYSLLVFVGRSDTQIYHAVQVQVVGNRCVDIQVTLLAKHIVAVTLLFLSTVLEFCLTSTVFICSLC